MVCKKCGCEISDSVEICEKCETLTKMPQLNTTDIVSQQSRQSKIAVLKEKLGSKFYVASGMLGLVLLIVVIATAIGINAKKKELLVAQEKEIQKAEVISTIENFNTDMKKCIDYSVVVRGEKIDFSPLSKYFGTSDDVDEQLNEWSASMLENHSTIGSIVEVVDSILLSDAVEFIPGVDKALSAVSGIISKGYKKDALFNEDTWSKLAVTEVTLNNLEITDMNQSKVELTISIEFNYAVFDNSAILKALKVVNMNYFPDEASSNVKEVTVNMIKDETSDQWLFTDSFFDNYIESITSE